MKIAQSFLILILCLMIVGCQDDNEPFLYDDTSQNPEINDTNISKTNPIKYPVQSENELIVKFFDTVDITEKYKKFLREKYDVVKHKTCDCNNRRLEKWTFRSEADIEKRKDDIAQEGGVEGVDYQFEYPNDNSGSTTSPTNHYQSKALITSSISPVKDKDDVTIAIIDTGINLDKLQNIQNTQHFLYYAGYNGYSCKGELSGWNFVNQDNNIFDDNGHGTIVANIIIKELKNQGVNNYQILPVKAFNKDGKGTTFDILCSYLYAVSKPDVSIINMSFGWYQYPSDLLSKFISQNPNILHLTSAGNSNNDNDDIYHFPSSITHRNVLSIGSYHQNNNYFKKSDFSNHGKFSVDFLSKGENIMSPFNGKLVEGTSYATPYVAAKAMKHYQDGYRQPYQIINQLRTDIYTLNNGSIPSIRYGNGVIK